MTMILRTGNKVGQWEYIKLKTCTEKEIINKGETTYKMGENICQLLI
jgi:hypothetical protein